MKTKESNWSNYYAIFLITKENGEEQKELIASAMTEEMAVDYAKFLNRKLEKQSNVLGLYVRKLFGEIVFACKKELINDADSKNKKK